MAKLTDQEMLALLREAAVQAAKGKARLYLSDKQQEGLYESVSNEVEKSNAARSAEFTRRADKLEAKLNNDTQFNSLAEYAAASSPATTAPPTVGAKLSVVIQSIPHKDQRYNTVGDWQFLPDGTILILVSEHENPEVMQAIAIHELAEAFFCRNNGVTQEEVDKFDMEFDGVGEPGDDPEAPYHEQHRVAEEVEGEFINQCAIHWGDYEAECEKLSNKGA